MASEVKILKDYQGKVAVYYSKYIDGKIKVLRYSTGIKTSERTKPDNVKIITSIESRIKRIIEDYTIKNGFQPPVDYVKDKIKEKELKSGNLFLDNFENFFETKKTDINIRPQSLKDYISFRNSILDYQELNKTSLYYENITADFLTKYVKFLASEKRPEKSKTRGFLNDNTIVKRVACLKTYIKYLEENQMFEFPVNVKTFKVKRYAVTIVYLSKDELRSLLNLDLHIVSEKVALEKFNEKIYELKIKDKESELKEYKEIQLQKDIETISERYKKIIDVFLVGALTSFRYSDLIDLKESDFFKYENNGKFEYKINKSSKKGGKDVKYGGYLSDRAAKILEENNFNLNFFANQRFNLYFKELCKHSGLFDELIEVKKYYNNKQVLTSVPKWSLLSSHSARRSFITNHVILNTPLNEIMECSSHKKIDTLNKYIVKFGANRETANKLDI